MLKAIPIRLLTHAAILYTPVSVDLYGKEEYTVTELSRTHLQATNSVKRTRDNREVVLRSILFYDAKNSLPRGLDFDQIMLQAEKFASAPRIEINGISYTLVSVDAVPDDRGRLHHYELGLV